MIDRTKIASLSYHPFLESVNPLISALTALKFLFILFRPYEEQINCPPPPKVIPLFPHNG